MYSFSPLKIALIFLFFVCSVILYSTLFNLNIMFWDFFNEKKNVLMDYIVFVIANSQGCWIQSTIPSLDSVNNQSNITLVFVKFLQCSSDSHCLTSFYGSFWNIDNVLHCSSNFKVFIRLPIHIKHVQLSCGPWTL